jgi:hypothetical protein
VDSKIIRWIAERILVWVAGLIYGTIHIALPTWAQLSVTGLVVAAAVFAVLSITWWTHRFGARHQRAGTAIRVAMWLTIATLVIIWIAEEPKAGAVALAALIWIAVTARVRRQTDGTTGTASTGRFWRWIRREHLAPRGVYAEQPKVPAPRRPLQWDVEPVTAESANA